MVRPFQVVKVYGVQDRRSNAKAKLPWVVRLSIDGRQRSRSFRTRAEGERYRNSLLQAVHAGDRFDPATGEPVSWRAPLSAMSVREWSTKWLGEQWLEWQPRTRVSAVQALTKFVILAVRPGAVVPDGLRAYLTDVLPPDSVTAKVPLLERWLAGNGLMLGDLDRSTIASIDRLLGVRLDGGLHAANTVNRMRIVARACVHAAVESGAVPAGVWPTRSRSRSRRKVNRLKPTVDVRALPSPETMARAIEAIVSMQPASRKYRVMTAVAYYAGLRPSEVIMLRVRALTLPMEGWGRIDVTEADISFDMSGEPKTPPRSVPIPPVLVGVLRDWLTSEHLCVVDALLFRTRADARPTSSNWSRAWHRALASIGERPMRVYDCRHAAATTWLAAGVPLREVARRMGHSVETLVSTYVGLLDNDEQTANERIQALIGLDGGAGVA